MRIHLSPIALILLTSLAFGAGGKISGSLLDENGAPVPHMGVQARPTDIGFDGSLPGATTDDHGRFVIPIRVLSGEAQHWVVYPYDEKTGYYPRPYSFYGNDVPQPKVVDLSVRFPRASVELRLGPKVGALNVRLAGTPAIDTQPTFKFVWVSESAKDMSRECFGPTKSYRILLPANTSLTLTVTSPGYKPWSYPGVISVASGQDTPLDIQLEPETNDGSEAGVSP
jgi:hypothetical protein